MAESRTRSEGLDPVVRALFEVMDAKAAPPIESLGVDEARRTRTEFFKKMGGTPVELARVEDLRIPGPGGEIPVRLYAKEVGGLRPGMVYFHGGGFVIGDLNTHDAFCRKLAKESGAVVVAVGYRLAPENRFPAAVEDAFAATLWIAENAEELGIDARRLVVCGDSAGGTLATVVAARCRNAGGPRLAAQVLIYPITDVSRFDSRSYRDFGGNYMLTRTTMQWFAAHYLGDTGDGLNPEASPLLAKDLHGLPPALLITAEFDPLRDEGEAYARRMKEAGTAVNVTRYPGLIHGFAIMLAVLDEGNTVIREVAEFVKGME